MAVLSSGRDTHCIEEDDLTSRHNNWRWIAMIAIAALTTAAVFATACGDDDDDGDGNGGDTTPAAQTPATSATEPAEEPTEPAAGETEPAGGDGETISSAEDATLGTILVGPDGLTLYTFTNDTAGSGESACYDACASAWPPLTSEDPTAGEGITGELSTIERTDGAMQVTYDGMPLYYFASDTAPGDTNGHEVGGVWFVAEP
jgi:predicted lipoprotein with Yx(FWY)xxD motif